MRVKRKQGRGFPAALSFHVYKQMRASFGLAGGESYPAWKRAMVRIHLLFVDVKVICGG